jgi:LysR family transcriptional activator of nhaA
MQNADWMNYHHLFYFWKVAQEGSLSRAADQLRLSHSTLSTQIRALEGFLGGDLFLRSGRALSLTVLGRDVLEYADEIFRVGNELVEMAASRTPAHRVALRLGVVDAVPKTIAYRFVEPALKSPEHAPIYVRQDKMEVLLEEMAAGRLHLILSDQPPPQGFAVHLYCSSLWETSVLLYGTPELAAKYKEGFPRSLDGAPLLLPAALSNLRRLLDGWFAERGLHVDVVGEFDDAATLRLFGDIGHGLFPVGAALAAEVEGLTGAVCVGELTGLHERFYAISTERRVRRAEMKLMLDQAGQRRLEPLLRSRA